MGPRDVQSLRASLMMSSSSLSIMESSENGVKSNRGVKRSHADTECTGDHNIDIIEHTIDDNMELF